jgi:hypothetical protein
MGLGAGGKRNRGRCTSPSEVSSPTRTRTWDPAVDGRVLWGRRQQQFVAENVGEMTEFDGTGGGARGIRDENLNDCMTVTAYPEG